MKPTNMRAAIERAGGLVNVREAAVVLGVSRKAVEQRAARAAERKWVGFVEPVAYLPPDGRGRRGSPLWTREQMQAQREVDEAQRVADDALA